MKHHQRLKAELLDFAKQYISKKAAAKALGIDPRYMRPSRMRDRAVYSPETLELLAHRIPYAERHMDALLSESDAHRLRGRPNEGPTAPKEPDAATQMRVIDAIGSGELTAAQIARRSGLPMDQVQASLDFLTGSVIDAPTYRISPLESAA